MQSIRLHTDAPNSLEKDFQLKLQKKFCEIIQNTDQKMAEKQEKTILQMVGFNSHGRLALDLISTSDYGSAFYLLHYMAYSSENLSTTLEKILDKKPGTFNHYDYKPFAQKVAACIKPEFIRFYYTPLDNNRFLITIFDKNAFDQWIKNCRNEIVETKLEDFNFQDQHPSFQPAAPNLNETANIQNTLINDNFYYPLFDGKTADEVNFLINASSLSTSTTSNTQTYSRASSSSIMSSSSLFKKTESPPNPRKRPLSGNIELMSKRQNRLLIQREEIDSTTTAIEGSRNSLRNQFLSALKSKLQKIIVNEKNSPIIDAIVRDELLSIDQFGVKADSNLAMAFKMLNPDYYSSFNIQTMLENIFEVNKGTLDATQYKNFINDVILNYRSTLGISKGNSNIYWDRRENIIDITLSQASTFKNWVKTCLTNTSEETIAPVLYLDPMQQFRQIVLSKIQEAINAIGKQKIIDSVFHIISVKGIITYKLDLSNFPDLNIAILLLDQSLYSKNTLEVLFQKTQVDVDTKGIRLKLCDYKQIAKDIQTKMGISNFGNGLTINYILQLNLDTFKTWLNLHCKNAKEQTIHNYPSSHCFFNSTLSGSSHEPVQYFENPFLQPDHQSTPDVSTPSWESLYAAQPSIQPESTSEEPTNDDGFLYLNYAP